MPANPSNPHDAYFRRVLSRPADAACELRVALPAAITSRINWDQLHLESGSYVSSDLRSRYSDLLYRTRLDGHTAYIYLLIEHQSSADRFMPLRILEYMVNIWTHYRDHNPGTQTLPAVIPLVVHSNHTGKPWTYSTEIAELIDLDSAAREAIGPYLPQLRFLLDDIAPLDLATLRKRDLTPHTRIMLSLHKIAPRKEGPGPDILSLTDDLRALLHGPDGKAEFQAVLTYILTVSEATEADLVPMTDRLGPQAKEVLMTTAERLRAEGHAEGHAEGRATERAETLIELLTLKFGPLPAATVTRIRTAPPGQTHTWTTHIFAANTLDEVFA